MLIFGNHDHQRLLTRIGSDPRLASLLAVFQFTARGVPVTYYGEEIGMTELLYPREQSKDPVGKRFSWIPDFALKVLNLYASRDGCRTPMQWEPVKNAGFTLPGTETWLPINEHSNRVNVTSEMEQPESLLNVYHNLLRIRRGYSALQNGSLEIIKPDRGGTLNY